MLKRNYLLKKKRNIEKKRNTFNKEIIDAENYINKMIERNLDAGKNNINKNFNFFKYDIEETYGKYLKKRDNLFNKYNFSDLTFIVVFQNRVDRFNKFFEYNKNFFIKYDIKVIFVEGYSNNMINENIFSKYKFIKYFKVNTNKIWSRSKLLNFGINKSDTDILLLTDIDFFFTKKFWENILLNLNHNDFSKNILGIPLYETFYTYDNDKKLVRKIYEPYSSFYVVEKKNIVKVGGFDTTFINFGYEERELQCRLKNNGINLNYTSLIFPFCYVLHYSHNHNTRGKKNVTINKKKMLQTKKTKIKKIKFIY